MTESNLMALVIFGLILLALWLFASWAEVDGDNSPKITIKKGKKTLFLNQKINQLLDSSSVRDKKTKSLDNILKVRALATSAKLTSELGEKNDNIGKLHKMLKIKFPESLKDLGVMALFKRLDNNIKNE